MKISELLTSIASWLESPENEALLLSEYNEECLDIVATACVQAASLLKKAAEETDKIEPEQSLTSDDLDHLGDIITAFDNSLDEDLQKTASVMDQLLLTLAVPPNWVSKYKEAQENRLDVLKQKYEENREALHKEIGVKESEKAIDKSPMYKDYKIMEHALSTRTCPDHAGAQMGRVGENMWQCSLDKKTYNYSTGYTTEKGERVPGGDVAQQTPSSHQEPHSMFDTREQRLTGEQR